MRLSLRIATAIAMAVVVLASAGCQHEVRWERKNTAAIGAVARDVAARARGNDTRYFIALSPARERVPSLMRQVLRSGLETNYADHLVVESATEAALAYGVQGDHTPGTSFAVRLSIVDGKVRVDQIIAYAEGTTASVGSGEPTHTARETFGSSRVSPWAITDALVCVKTPPGTTAAGGELWALIGYTNTSERITGVSLPLHVVLSVVDNKRRLVSTFETPDVFNQTSVTFVAPMQTIYQGATFRVREPGLYTLYVSANDIQAPPITFETTYRR